MQVQAGRNQNFWTRQSFTFNGLSPLQKTTSLRTETPSRRSHRLAASPDRWPARSTQSPYASPGRIRKPAQDDHEIHDRGDDAVQPVLAERAVGAALPRAAAAQRAPDNGGEHDAAAAEVDGAELAHAQVQYV